MGWGGMWWGGGGRMGWAGVVWDGVGRDGVGWGGVGCTLLCIMRMGILGRRVHPARAHCIVVGLLVGVAIVSLLNGAWDDSLMGRCMGGCDVDGVGDGDAGWGCGMGMRDWGWGCGDAGWGLGWWDGEGDGCSLLPERLPERLPEPEAHTQLSHGSHTALTLLS